MTEHPLSIDALLHELKDALVYPDTTSVRTTNAVQLISRVLRTVTSQPDIDRIRVLTESGAPERNESAFLVQIDDYDIRLRIWPAAQRAAGLTHERLLQLQTVLEENPGTVALILAWTTDELLSVPLSTTRIRYLLQNPGRVARLLTTAQPLPETLRKLIAQQIRIWDVHLDDVLTQRVEALNIHRFFETALLAGMEAERKRTYRAEERKRAAMIYPASEERRIMMSVFEAALKGVDGPDLIAQLTRLPRRGTK